MGEVIQLQGDQRKDVKDFLIDKKEGLELDSATIKVYIIISVHAHIFTKTDGLFAGPWLLAQLRLRAPVRLSGRGTEASYFSVLPA